MLKKQKGVKSKGNKPSNPTRLTRKEKRKQGRQMKKQQKQENFRKYLDNKKSRQSYTGGRFVKAPQNTSDSPKPDKNSKKLGKSLGDKMQAEILGAKEEQLKLAKDMKKQRLKKLAEENEEEEKNIQRLEKLLKLNKRKSSSVPKSFADCGFDYILDVCDSSKVQAAVQAEMNLQECASDFDEDLAIVTGKGQSKKKNLVKTKMDKGKKSRTRMNDSEDDVIVKDSNVDDSDSESDEPLEYSSKKGDARNTKYNAKSSKQNESTESLDAEQSDDDDYDSDGSFSGDEDDGLDVFDDLDESSDCEKSKELKSTESTKGSKRKANDGAVESKKKVKFSAIDSDEDDLEGEYDSTGIEESDENDFSEDEGKKNETEVIKEKTKDDANGVHQDIYGRLRDKDGNIIKDTSSKYVPPHLRNNPVDDKRRAELEKLAKTLKGLLNRLAENNMHSIANQIDELYMRHSRHDMNTTLIKQYLESLVAPVHTPERLVMEHAMLIAVLHANVGSEIGAFFLQHLGKRFDEMHAVPVEVENKELDNLLLLLCHMYTFKIFDSVLLYDILERIAHKFTPKDIDLILVILRSVGFALRKDNPLALKDFILKVQKLANNAGVMANDSRVRFMLDVLLSIKNNNVSKIPQYDTTHSEHLKKIIKPMFRPGNYVTELKISLEELLKADERGKWWVVGSAWSGPAPQHDKPKSSSDIPGVNSFTREILELAKKQRMNTANRKNIFCILMTAEDYLDAFEKLLKLGLKGQPEQDIVHVLIHCLLSEKDYNPYYSHIADQLCTSNRKHRMTIQYATWDRFKELKTHSNHQLTNLAKFLAHLFIQNSLPLSMLKVLEFTEMNKPCVRLLRQILLSLLLHDDREAMVGVFSRVAKPAKLSMFRESIRLFMHHFLLKNIKDEDNSETVKLKDAIALAEQALMEFSDMS